MGNIGAVIPRRRGLGNRTSMMVTAGGVTRTQVYTYDNIYQVTGVDYPPELGYLATDTTFNYDAAGNRTSVIDGSGTCTYTANNLNEYTGAGTTSFQYDDSGNMTADGTYTYDYDPENRLIRAHKSTPGDPSPTWQPLETFAAYTQGGDAPWVQDTDFAHSGDISDSQQSWMQIGVEGPGTVKFQWKVSSESGYDYLEFWVDGMQRDAISGSTNWAEKTFTVTGAGTHTLKWRYSKDGSVSQGEDRGWLDGVQWAGSDPWDNWTTLLYRYDAAGRRVEKLYNYVTITKYVYDGDHCIAEYDGSSNLQRKYIYGPCTDEPISMIESAGSYAGTYYYHFDALGSVVGLTNASGNTVEVYEYDVYGRVGATDASHPNRFMFTGREYDKETGLYYYRARYYNPQIGRFLQTDPTGYKDGMNWYAYCHNNATCDADPTGLETVYTFLDMASAHATAGLLTFAKVVDNQVVQTQGFADTKAWMNWAKDHPYYFENGPSKWVPEIEKRTGYKLASAAEAEDKENQSTVFSDVFWALQALQFMGDSVAELERTGVETIHIVVARKGGLLDQYNSATNTLKWNINDSRLGRGSEWLDFKDPLIALAHELVHARDDVISHMAAVDEVHAVRSENNVRALFRAKAPKCRDLYPRPGWSVLYADIAPGCDAAWALYRPQNVAK